MKVQVQKYFYQVFNFIVKGYGKEALEGRQDKKVAEDRSNDEEGLESLGRPANEYVKKRIDK